MTATPTRRERQRQATFEEIVDVARGLLRRGEDVSIRAVAQEMGLTPPALYRYVDSHAELMVLVVRSVFGDVVDAMRVARDAQGPDDPSARIVAAAAAFRRWALDNTQEFQLVFASTTSIELSTPPQGSAPPAITSLDSCLPTETGVDQFGRFFSEIFGQLWEKYHFAIPPDSDLDPALLEALQADITPAKPTHGAMEQAPSPGMVWMFERAWARLYGTVTLEVFGHVHPALISTGALFAATMLDIGRELGIADEWPRLQLIARAQY